MERKITMYFIGGYMEEIEIIIMTKYVLDEIIV
jgi:hypothetical protein